MLTSRQSLAIFGATGVLLAVAGCARSQHSADEKYYLVATNIKLPYWQSALGGLRRAAGDLNVAAQLVGPETYDPKAQQAEFLNLLHRDPKPSGILVSPADPALMGSDIQAAMQQGIPVITVDSDAAASQRLLFIGTDNYKAGTMGGQLTAKLLQGRGNVVIMGMPEQLNLSQRLRGYQDAFASHPQIKVLQVVNIKGDPVVAFDSTKELLASNTKVDAFVCLEAIACPEVAEVVNRNKLTGKIVIVAMDTDQRTLEGIQKGWIAATVGQRPFTMVYHGVMLLDQFHHHPLKPLIADWAHDPMSPIPVFVDTGATMIDKSNLSGFLTPTQASTGF
jgi:ribose transport system substrate-binding protein